MSPVVLLLFLFHCDHITRKAKQKAVPENCSFPPQNYDSLESWFSVKVESCIKKKKKTTFHYLEASWQGRKFQTYDLDDLINLWNV